MATTGSTSISVTAYDTLKFTWTQIGQSVANNTTTISWSLQLVSGSAGRIVSTAEKSWSVTIDGSTYSGKNSVAIENSATKTLASGQTTITHNQDGARSFNYSFSQTFDITFAGASVGTKSGSGTGTLNTIPRATQPTLHTNSIDMGGTVTIYTPRASEAFTHDLAYSFAGGAYIDIQKDVGAYMYWAVPFDLANSIPNTTSGTVTIRCITKNGSTVVGTKTVLLTAKVPASFVPNISAVTHEEANSTVASTIGEYVQSKTKLRVSITAAGPYGSTIKSYSSVLGGKTYTGASWTSDEVQQSGTVNIVTTVTDSRGRTASKTTSVSILAYEPPKITAFSVARYNANGVADPNGDRVWVTRAYTVASLNGKNTASAKMDFKRSTDTVWTGLYTSTTLSASGVLKPDNYRFSTDYQYDFRYTVADAFTATTPATYNIELPSGAVILDIKADGKGIAFFKTSTKDGVEIVGELPGSAIQLTTNANLNDLTTPGFYAIPSTTVSATILNKPYTDTSTACIEVKRTGTGAVKQIIQKASKTDGAIYERDKDSSGWGAWNIVYSGAGRVLWTGSLLMTSSQTVTFSETLDRQQSGIILVFSRYIDSKAQDYIYSCHFVPKQLAALASANGGQSAAGVMFTMNTSRFEAVTTKYLKITNTGITGDSANGENSTNSGVTYRNDQFALRYVIGV